MADKEIYIEIINDLGKDYTFFIENYAEEEMLENRIVFVLSNQNQLEMIIDHKYNEIVCISKFIPSNDKELKKEFVDDLLDEVNNSLMPFDTLDISDEHNGLELIKYISIDEYQLNDILNLLNYLDNPNKELKRLMFIRNI